MSRLRSDHDYMMRSEKRPGVRPEPSRRSRPKKSKRHPVYAFFTILLLIILYPVGLIMLWLRKLRWRSLTKLLTSIVTGVLFFVLVAFALNAQVDNPVLAGAQAGVKQQLTHVAGAVTRAVSNKDAIEHNLKVEGPRIVNLAANGAAQALIRTVPEVRDNLHTLYNRADTLALNVAEYIGRESRDLFNPSDVSPANSPTPTSSSSPAPSPNATADATPAATVQPTLSPTPSPAPSPTPTQTASDTPGPDPTDAPGATASPALAAPTPGSATPQSVPVSAVVRSPLTSATVSPTPYVPTPSPTPRPTPTPNPTPVPLPSAKPFGETVVYYFDGSKGYHLGSTCGSMKNAPPHTLTQAIEDGKKRCTGCKSPESALLDAEFVVWCGSDNVFHITDECAALTQKWTGLPFEEAWLEDGMSGCLLCGADLYMDARKLTPTVTPVPAPVMPNPAG